MLKFERTTSIQVSFMCRDFKLVSFHLFEKLAVTERHGRTEQGRLWRAGPVHQGYRLYSNEKPSLVSYPMP